MEPRAEFAAVDVRNLFTERLDDTFFESDVSGLLWSHQPLIDLGLSCGHLGLERGRVDRRFQQGLPHRRVRDSTKHIVANLVDSGIRCGHQRVDANNTVSSVRIDHVHTANLSRTGVGSIKFDLQTSASSDLCSGIDIRLADSRFTFTALETAVDVVVDLAGGSNTLFVAPLLLLVEKLLSSHTLFHEAGFFVLFLNRLSLSNILWSGTHPFRHLLSFSSLILFRSVLVSVLKRVLTLLGYELWKGCRIIDDASDIRIVGQLVDALTRDLDLNTLSRLLDEVSSRFGLRLPPVGVFFCSAFFSDRSIALIDLSSKELLWSNFFAPDTKSFFTRCDELFWPLSHKPSAVQIGLLCFRNFR